MSFVWVYLRVIAWNVYVGHAPGHVVAVLVNLVRDHRPDVIVLQEARRLHGRVHLAGYRIHQQQPRARRKGHQPGAGNIAILVRDGVKVSRLQIMWMRLAWRGPKRGLPQDPRAYLWLRVTKQRLTWKVGGFHFPFGAARAESIKAVKDWFRKTFRGRPTVAVGDWNMSGADTSKAIARPVGARTLGSRIDHAIYRNCEPVKLRSLGKHGSDHPVMLYIFRARAWRVGSK